MPGKTITNQQYRLYMELRKLGVPQTISAAKAGFCERSGRTLEKARCLPSHNKTKRGRKTGSHIFVKIWDTEIVPLLQKSPHLSAITILEHIQDLYPDCYAPKSLRSLQRLVRHWRAVHGSEQEVIFRQIHTPGLQGLSDFTSLKACHITIQGQPFDHLLYHFRLAYSCWSHMEIVQGGESFSALSMGLQNALTKLGGSPQEHRTDSLSAGFKNLSKLDKEDVTERYDALCRHYQMTPTRNNRGKGHENGSVESAHGHLKRNLEQALVIRGSYNFESIEDYQQFIDTVVNRHNKRHQKQIIEERQQLELLPNHRAAACDLMTVRVTTSSTIFVKNVVYSVPSRLIGQQVRIHLYSDHLIGYLGSDPVFEMKRQKSLPGNRQYCINYRHVIKSLSIKPQAFRFSVLKDALLPNALYKEIWQNLNRICVSRHACKLIVGILKISSDYECEEDLGCYVSGLLNQGIIPSLGSLQQRYEKKDVSQKEVPHIAVPVHNIAAYDKLLPSSQQGEVCHA